MKTDTIYDYIILGYKASKYPLIICTKLAQSSLNKTSPRQTMTPPRQKSSEKVSPRSPFFRKSRKMQNSPSVTNPICKQSLIFRDIFQAPVRSPRHLYRHGLRRRRGISSGGGGTAPDRRWLGEGGERQISIIYAVFENANGDALLHIYTQLRVYSIVLDAGMYLPTHPPPFPSRSQQPY